MPIPRVVGRWNKAGLNLAAGGCELRTRGRTIQLTGPRLFHDEARRDIRPLERQALRAMRVADFLSLTTE
jgi:hypothetical protein